MFEVDTPVVITAFKALFDLYCRDNGISAGRSREVHFADFLSWVNSMDEYVIRERLGDALDEQSVQLVLAARENQSVADAVVVLWPHIVLSDVEETSPLRFMQVVVMLGYESGRCVPVSVVAHRDAMTDRNIPGEPLDTAAVVEMLNTQPQTIARRIMSEGLAGVYDSGGALPRAEWAAGVIQRIVYDSDEYERLSDDQREFVRSLLEFVVGLFPSRLPAAVAEKVARADAIRNGPPTDERGRPKGGFDPPR